MYQFSLSPITATRHSGSGLEDRCCGHELAGENQSCVKAHWLYFTPVVIDMPEGHDAWCYGGNQYQYELLRLVTYDSSEKVRLVFLLCFYVLRLYTHFFMFLFFLGGGAVFLKF